jgi:hypothetical protein
VSQTQGGDLPYLTAENIREKMNTARDAYLYSTKHLIKQNLETCYTAVMTVTTLLYDELENAAKELALYRELYFFVNSGSLETEKWQDIVGQLGKLQEERVATIAARREEASSTNE